MTKIKFLFILLLFISYHGFAQPTGYTYVKNITINASEIDFHATKVLINFPILISVTDNDLRDTISGGRVTNSNGYDIIFTTDDCLTPLDHEIEYYVSTSGEYVAWVKIPSLSRANDTEIHMYYGNSSITTDPSTPDVWENDYLGVYHLYNSTISDATSFGNNGSNSGSSNNNNGQVYRGRRIGNGSNPEEDFIGIPTNDVASAFATDGLTIEFWINSYGFATSPDQFMFGHTGDPSYSDRIQIYTTGSDLRLGLGDDHTKDVGILTMSASTWYYVALALDNTDQTYSLYVNGARVSQGSYTGLNSFNSVMDLGNDGNTEDGRTQAADAKFDELRITDKSREQPWLITTYNNINNPSAFTTFGSEAPAATLCAPLPIVLTNFSAKRINPYVINLAWETQGEMGNDYFVIERSSDLMVWEILDTISGAGYSRSTLHYSSIVDDHMTLASYYRLKQVDYDASYTYSKIIAVNSSENEFFYIYPNPAKSQVTLEGNEIDENGIEVYNSIGKRSTDLVKLKSVNDAKIVIDVSKLKPGLYFISKNNSIQKLTVY